MRYITMAAAALALAGCDGAAPPDAMNSATNEAAATEIDAGNAVAEDDAVAGDNVAVAETPAASPASGWVGRWVGPEGLYVDIKPDGGADSGRFTLKMKYTLDDEGSFAGRAVADGIAFERGGKTETLKAATGGETGMKWLADKKDCLVVATGEGYCRG